MDRALVEVKVWGPHACFTRPETKMEPVSYPVITPSAARNILQAIFWKPEFQYHVREIVVLKPIRHFSMVTNEITSRQSIELAQGWAKTGYGNYFSDDSKQRTQRHMLGLRDVAYLIRADVVPEPHSIAPAVKYQAQFERRVSRGQCFRRPFLGVRQYAAHFGPADGTERAIDLDDDLGLMLFDCSFRASGEAVPIFARFSLRGGILRIPPELYTKRAAREG